MPTESAFERGESPGPAVTALNGENDNVGHDDNQQAGRPLPATEIRDISGIPARRPGDRDCTRPHHLPIRMANTIFSVSDYASAKALVSSNICNKK